MTPRTKATPPGILTTRQKAHAKAIYDALLPSERDIWYNLTVASKLRYIHRYEATKSMDEAIRQFRHNTSNPDPKPAA